MPVIELTAVAPSLIASLRDVRVRVDDARRHELAGAVDDLRAGRNLHVGADRGDLAVAQHDRAVVDGAAAGDGDDRRIANRDDTGRWRAELVRPRSAVRIDRAGRTAAASAAQRDEGKTEGSTHQVNLQKSRAARL